MLILILCLSPIFFPDTDACVPRSNQDVVCPEAVKLDDLDSGAVTSQFEAAKSAFSAAASGSIEQAEAQIDMEVNRAMALALGMNLS